MGYWLSEATLDKVLAECAKFRADREEEYLRMVDGWWQDDESSEPAPLNVKGAREAFRLIAQIGVNICAGCCAALAAPLTYDQDGRLWHNVCYRTLRCAKCLGPLERQRYGAPVCGYCARTPWGRWCSAWGAMGHEVAARRGPNSRLAKEYAERAGLAGVSKEERWLRAAWWAKWRGMWGDIARIYDHWSTWRQHWLCAWRDIGISYQAACDRHRIWLADWVAAWRGIGWHVNDRYVKRAYDLLNEQAARSSDAAERRFAQLEIDRSGESATPATSRALDEDDAASKRFRLLEIDR